MQQTVMAIRDPRMFFSASLVGELDAEEAERRLGWRNGPIRHVKVHGDAFGLIVDLVDARCVYAGSHLEVGAPTRQDLLAEYAMRRWGKIDDPVDPLTKAAAHNELVIRGNRCNGIVGIMITRAAGGSSESRSRAVDDAFRFKGLLRLELGKDVPVLVKDQHAFMPNRAVDYPAEPGRIAAF